MRIGTSKTNKESYEPTRSEVFTKMTGNIYKSCKDFSDYFLFTSRVPYIIPTSIREYYDDCENNKSDTSSDVEASGVEAFAMNLGMVGQFVFYCSNPDYMLLPVLTNLASVGCEGYRYTKNKMSEKHKAEMVDQIKS